MVPYQATKLNNNQSPMQPTASTDIVIIGGGIAGLWLLTRLRQAGFQAILLESTALGSGQTHKAQGIIHGGMKYALQGVMTADAQAISSMPARWQACLAGQGEIDLSIVPILSTQQHLWSTNTFAAKLTGFFASTTLTSSVITLNKTDYPSAFQHPAFKGEVLALDEIVIDVPALVRTLAKINQGFIFHVDAVLAQDLHWDTQGRLHAISISRASKALTLQTQHVVFTAGAGNELLATSLPSPGIAMQRRPLHMVWVKIPFQHAVYAHCLGLSARPRITITTHYHSDGSYIWYLGGALAEEGVTRTPAAQIQAARTELQTLFHWLDFSKAEFATFMIDRAEPWQKSGFKPDHAYCKTLANVTVAWPTKLALAPQLADDILQELAKLAITPAAKQPASLDALHDWPAPPVAPAIWEC